MSFLSDGALARLRAAASAPDFGSTRYRLVGEVGRGGMGTVFLAEDPFPPFAHIALLRAESKRAGEAAAFLRTAARIARPLSSKVEIFDPVPAPLERKAGFDRAQLLVRASSRAALQPFLRRWREALLEKDDRRVRWSLDVDPQES